MKVMEETDRYLSITEAANAVHKHRNTIYLWIRQGLLRYHRPGGHGHYQLRESDVKAVAYGQLEASQEEKDN